MSTKNNAAQTLFRFVSLRNPQLTETNNKNFGFIQRPAGVGGVFDSAITSRRGTKKEALSLIESGFTGHLSTVQDVESIFPDLLKLGKKITKREELKQADWELASQFYNTLLDVNGTLSTNGRSVLEQLWNNFIYQVVSESDFYVKEAVSNVLKAIHLGHAQSVPLDEEVIKINGSVNPLYNALNAKIVLPKELFVEDENVTSTGATLNNASQQRLKVNALNEIKVNAAEIQKNALEKLKMELEKIQKSYFLAREKAYREALLLYNTENAEQIALSEAKQDEIDAAIERGATQAEIDQLHQELLALQVASFEFSYKNEINLTDLEAQLSPESFDLFMELFSNLDYETADFSRFSEGTTEVLSDTTMRVGTETLTVDDSYQSYFSIFEKLDADISYNVGVGLDNTALPQNQYANIGGALIPVNTGTNVTHLAYNLIANWKKRILFPAGTGSVNFSFEVENNSWDVASAKMTAVTDMGTFTENIGGVSVLNNKITFSPTFVNKFTSIASIKIEIYFTNGTDAELELVELQNNELYNGILILNRPKVETPPEGSPQEPTGGKRKNFGIKRLGIADYLKVVQSVHAYVPGEVSNIENVMASELRQKSSTARDYSEITDTTSKSQETEKISDTTKTSRTDMQTEVAKELDRQQSFSAHTRASGKAWTWSMEVGAEYANTTAQHDSTRQAVMKSQEITERAMERVLTKISEERVQKIIKEYTETNVHEFDNRGKVTDTDNPDAAKPRHITGVYRWIDKKMKNQIYNYGKRTMFEFMVPEPARLHRLAFAVSKAEQLTAPVDPRKAPEPWTMANPKSATVEQIQHWAQIYGVSLEAFLANTKQIIHSTAGVPQTNDDFLEGSAFQIPDNYAAKNASFSCRSSRNRGGGFSGARYSKVVCSNLKGDMIGREVYGDVNFDESVGGLNVTGNVDFRVSGHNVQNYNIKVIVNCELSNEYIDKWKTESFNAIIAAYEKAYQDFQDKQAALDAAQAAKEAEAKEKLGNFYRYMESDVLKHNCIAYLLQDYLNTLGQVTNNGAVEGMTMDNYEVFLNENLDKYTALAKFMEQAFEWEIMDYTFYPYYWANRKKWQEMYISESVDPLFRSFLQAGMARVIVTVKPGFEDAVQFFLETGKIWNGGVVPVIGDPMYMSIVDEMKEPTGKPLGKYWITRIPTTLTILQDKSTGLEVDQPLPIFPEAEPANCENPSELETDTSFRHDDISMGTKLGVTSTLSQGASVNNAGSTKVIGGDWS